MKRSRLLSCLLVAAFALATATSIHAQTSDAEADALVNLLGVQKKEIMRELISVTKKDSAAFWKIYDEYSAVNKKQSVARLKLYERTAMAYSSMNPATADSLATKYFINRSTQEKTLEEYYKKVKAATNAVVAFQFYQAEIYLLTQLRASIMNQIPAYGQVVNAMKKN